MKKIIIFAVSLMMVFAMSVNVFAGTKQEITQFSATCDWSKLTSSVEIGKEIPDDINDEYFGIPDGILQNFDSNKFQPLYQGWVRKYGEDWYAKGVTPGGSSTTENIFFEKDAEYAIGFTVRLKDPDNTQFCNGFNKDNINLGNENFFFYMADSVSIAFGVYAGTVEEIQAKVNPKPATGDSANILLYGCALLVAMLGTGTVLVVNRKKTK